VFDDAQPGGAVDELAAAPAWVWRRGGRRGRIELLFH